MNSSSRRPRTMPSSMPQETIADILSRLPVKSLARFRCVSKNFCNLTTNPTFVASHIRRAAHNPSLLIRRYYVPSGLDSGFWVLKNVGARIGYRIEDLEMPLGDSLCRLPRIVGSSNGLLCLDISACYSVDIVLWNPSTRQFDQLPQPSISCSQSASIWMVSLGFGFDGKGSDFKVVRIVYYKGKKGVDDIRPIFKAEVYSWRTGNWKEMEGLGGIGLCVISTGQSAVNLKGMLHWIAIGLQDMSNRKFLVSFDLNDESFKRFPLPAICRAGNVKVASYKESLALAVYFPPGTYASHIELYVMDESSSWVKLFTTENMSRAIVPVGFWKDHEVIVKQIKGEVVGLWLYDWNTGEAKSIPLDGAGYSLDVYDYVESLVSVSGRS